MAIANSGPAVSLVVNSEEVVGLAEESGLSEEQARAFLEAQARRGLGAPLTTIEKDPSNHNAAVRTQLPSGKRGWWVIDHSDGSCTWHEDADKGWPALFTPEPPPTDPIA